MAGEVERRLLETGLSLAALGEQVEAARAVVCELVEQRGLGLSSPEVLEATRTFNLHSNQFLALEERFETLKAQLRDPGARPRTDDPPGEEEQRWEAFLRAALLEANRRLFHACPDAPLPTSERYRARVRECLGIDPDGGAGPATAPPPSP